MNSRLLLSCCASAIFTALAPSVALAQADTSGGDDVEKVQEVVVTATRREEVASRIGASITALSAERMENLGFDQTEDLAQVVPGFTVALSPQNTPIYTLRGVGFNTQNMSSTSPVGVYLDGVAYPYAYMAQGLTLDLSRVEVLRGPQGTLFGRNTTGGLVHYIANAPTDTFEASLSGEAGSFESYSLEGVISGPLAPGLSGRMAVRTDQREEGWQRSVTRDETLGQEDRLAARGTLLWNASDAFEATLTASYWRNRSDTQAPQAIEYLPTFPMMGQPLLAGPSILTNPDARDADWTAASVQGPGQAPGARPPYRADGEFFGAALRMQWDISDTLQLSSITAYNHVNRGDVTNYDGLGAIEALSFVQQGEIESISQELHADMRLGAHDVIVGLYYSKDDVVDNTLAFNGNNTSINFLRFFASMVPSSYTPAQIAEGFRNYRNILRETNESRSIFIDDTWSLSDAWRLRLGARWNEDELAYEGCSADYDGNTAIIWNTAVAAAEGTVLNVLPNECITLTANGSALNGISRQNLTEDSLSGRAVLEWQIDPETMLYGSISRGYKAGVFPSLAASVVTQLAPARQEELAAYELGAKLRLFNNAMMLTSAVYYYDYSDKQVYGRVLDPVFTTLPQIINVPESQVYGAEFDMNWYVTESWALRLAASYLQSEIGNFQNYDEFGAVFDFTGHEFAYAPQWQLSGDVTYTRTFGPGYALMGILSASYQSESEGSPTGADRFAISERTLWNFNAEITSPSGAWTAGLWAENLLDEYYWTTSDFATDTVYRYAGMPRTVGVSLRYRLQ